MILALNACYFAFSWLKCDEIIAQSAIGRGVIASGCSLNFNLIVSNRPMVIVAL